jgi:hypothetical protein
VPISFDYAVVRVVPRVEREEFVNAGVILFCKEQRFLRARVQVDEARLRALWPDIDMDTVRRHVEAIPAICDGIESAGPIARMELRERFHWLVAPRSTVVQVSPVHSGMCEAPEIALDKLFATLVPPR